MRRAALALLVLAGSARAAAPDPHAPDAHRAWVNYVLECQGCHLPDGSGMAGKVPQMRGMLGAFLRVPGGRDYVVQVPGVATSKLSDAEVARLMNWLVREMGPMPPGFQDYSEQEVHALRARWLRAPGPVRARLVEAINRLPPAYARP